MTLLIEERLSGILQRAFAGKTTPKDRIQQIITSNLTVSVVGNLVYLISMAYINGARSYDRIAAAVRASFWFLMRVTWVTSPISIGVAQKFLPPQLWGRLSSLRAQRLDNLLTDVSSPFSSEPYFAFVRFILSTIFNT